MKFLPGIICDRSTHLHNLSNLLTRASISPQKQFYRLLSHSDHLVGIISYQWNVSALMSDVFWWSFAYFSAFSHYICSIITFISLLLLSIQSHHFSINIYLLSTSNKLFLTYFLTLSSHFSWIFSSNVVISLLLYLNKTLGLSAFSELGYIFVEEIFCSADVVKNEGDAWRKSGVRWYMHR